MAVNKAKYRRLLLEERDNLKQDVLGRTELPPNYVIADVEDSADHSVHEHGMDLEAQLMKMKSDRLQQINAALQRVTHGTYGICVKCGREIDEKRLDAEPTALTCVDCIPPQEQGFTAPTM
jgi:DnaK suppressor protein